MAASLWRVRKVVAGPRTLLVSSRPVKLVFRDDTTGEVETKDVTLTAAQLGDAAAFMTYLHDTWSTAFTPNDWDPA